MGSNICKIQFNSLEQQNTNTKYIWKGRWKRKHGWSLSQPILPLINQFASIIYHLSKLWKLLESFHGKVAQCLNHLQSALELPETANEWHLFAKRCFFSMWAAFQLHTHSLVQPFDDHSPQLFFQNILSSLPYVFLSKMVSAIICWIFGWNS